MNSFLTLQNTIRFEMVGSTTEILVKNISFTLFTLNKYSLVCKIRAPHWSGIFADIVIRRDMYWHVITWGPDLAGQSHLVPRPHPELGGPGHHLYVEGGGHLLLSAAHLQLHLFSCFLSKHIKNLPPLWLTSSVGSSYWYSSSTGRHLTERLSRVSVRMRRSDVMIKSITQSLLHCWLLAVWHFT